MKNSTKYLIVALLALCLIFALAFSACEGLPEPTNPNKPNEPNTPNTPTKKTFTGLTLNNLTVEWDGEEHEVTISGTLPDGAKVAYENNKAIEEGVYNVKATVTAEGYETLVLTAKLTITESTDPNAPQKITGVTFNDLTVDYNGQEHELTVSGTLPEGAKVEYTGNKGTNAGVYNAKATISAEGYRTLELTAKLTVNKINITGVTLSNLTVPYNGEEHAVTVSGTLPQGAKVAYQNNTATNAGEYNVTAAITYDNYNTLTLNAKLTITKIDITANLTFNNSTVEYDALPHSIQIVGTVPAGVVATYYYNDQQVNEVTSVGTYTVRCELSGQNYNTKTLTATLTIKGTEEQLFSAVLSNGQIFFQNNLDGNKLYKVSGSSVVKVNNDIPNYMINDGNKLYYYSSSLFSKVIKCYEGTTVSPLYSTKGEYLATDGTNIYYAINNTLVNTDQNGIYKLNLSAENAEPTKLTSDKAAYLVYANGYIYYSNLSESKKLYRVSANASNVKGTELWSEKVEYIIGDGTNLYFNSTKTVVGVGYAAAVYKYEIASNKTIKLTTDAGKYLTKVGSYIYYVNNDKITSELFGDGIYKVSALSTSDSSMPGTKVLSTDDNGFSSLASDGTNLYYYKLNDKHFYQYVISSNTETDLMQNFQPVEDTTLSGYSRVTEYKGEIYYTNPLDGSCLYKYNVATKAKYKVLADSVSNVSFYEYNGSKYMYYSTYIATNYALFRMDLDTNEVIKVTSKRVENLIFEGDKIYCTRVSFGTSYLMQIDLDGANEVELYKKTSLSSVGLEKIGNTFYFILDPATVGYKNVCVFTIGDSDKTDLHRASNFVTLNNKIYFYAHAKDNKGDNTEANALKVCDMDGSNVITIMQNVDITDMYAYNGKIYFTSISSQNTGLYVYDVATNQTKQISNKQAHGMVVYQNKLYFLQSEVTYTKDYPSQNSALDGKLYCYDGTNVTKVA